MKHEGSDSNRRNPFMEINWIYLEIWRQNSNAISGQDTNPLMLAGISKNPFIGDSFHYILSLLTLICEVFKRVQHLHSQIAFLILVTYTQNLHYFPVSSNNPSFCIWYNFLKLILIISLIFPTLALFWKWNTTIL